MDVGATNGWRMDDVVPAAEIVSTIGAEFPLEPVDAAYRGEVAERYRYLDGAGEIGVIASVTQPFCGDCTRARISADGKLYTCLFAVRGHDLRALLRSDAADELDETIRAVWTRRADRYSEIRTADTSAAAQGRDVVHRRIAHYAVGSRRGGSGDRPLPREEPASRLEARSARPQDHGDRDEHRRPGDEHLHRDVLSEDEPSERDRHDRIDVRVRRDERDRRRSQAATRTP